MLLLLLFEFKLSKLIKIIPILNKQTRRQAIPYQHRSIKSNIKRLPKLGLLLPNNGKLLPMFEKGSLPHLQFLLNSLDLKQLGPPLINLSHIPHIMDLLPVLFFLFLIRCHSDLEIGFVVG